MLGLGKTSCLKPKVYKSSLVMLGTSCATVSVVFFLTCELALVMFSRPKILASPLSALNLSSDRFTVSFTTGSFKLSAVGQSGHTLTTAVAGTEHRGVK